MPTLLYVFAFASGFAALAYQVAWTRMLSMTFGSSTLAASAVVAGFMGGMGLGAWLYHRVGDRIPSALRAYAILEVAIALTTAGFTLLYLRLPDLFAALATNAPGLAEATFVRVVTVAVLLFLPAALMGATYPALCRALIHSADDIERRLGWIYGINTLGGAAGSIVAGFVLIEVLGSSGTVALANLLNAAVGLGAFVLAGRSVADASLPDPSEVDESLPTDLPYWVTGLVLFGAGMATLGYEIVWLRALHYVLGPGAYALSSTLAIFLVGLGFGAVFYRTALRVGRPEWNLGFAQLAVATLAIVAIGAEHWILTTPEVFDRVSAFARSAYEEPWHVRLSIGVGLAVLLMLPATLWMGLAFPLASRLFLGSVSSLTTRTGLAYLLSNLGSIVGAIGAAVFVLPNLGTVGGTLLFVVVNVALGLLVLFHGTERRVKIAGAALAVVPLVLSSFLPDRLAFFPLEVREKPDVMKMVFEEESDLGTVQVFSRTDASDALAMSIDGTVIGCTRNWNAGLYSKQLILAHLPMALDRNITHTLNLGIASSSTINALGDYPWVETLDAIEINPAVMRATREFHDSEILEDPRANAYLEDAVHYLLRTPKRYDLIINDAKQSVKFGGSSKILSEEVYRYALGAMSECGLFAQFIPTTHPIDSLRLILRTFQAVFPETEIFLDAPSSIMLVGSRCPIGERERPSWRELYEAGVVQEIETVFVRDATSLPAMWVASGNELTESVGDGPLNDWNRLLLEFWSVRSPPFSRQLIADGMRFVYAPRQEGSTGDWPDTDRYEWGTIRLINEAIMSVYEDDLEAAMEAVNEARRRDPRHPLLKRVVR